MAVDVVDAERDDLGDAEAGGVGGHEDGAVLEAEDGGEEPGDLVGAEDGGELLGLLGALDALQDALSFEGDLVEEPEGGDGLVVDAPGDLLLLDEVEEVGADLVGPEGLGRAAEMACECGDPHGIGVDGPGGEVPELHVVDHPAAQRCHDVLPCRGEGGSIHHGPAGSRPERDPSRNEKTGWFTGLRKCDRISDGFRRLAGGPAGCHAIGRLSDRRNRLMRRWDGGRGCWWGTCG